MIIEVCASSILSIKNAFNANADRIEICSALDIGGLTPSFGLLKEAIDLKLLPINCLIRPREGHFFYSKEETKIIEKDIISALDAGCNGIVVGVHSENFELDVQLLKKWRHLAKSVYFTFHRAFDVLINPEKALEQLIDIGFDCVLTSGQNEKAIDGIKNLKYWNKKFGSKITIMPGGGINISNCEYFKNAGFTSVHLSGRKKNIKIPIPREVNKELSFLNQIYKECDFKIIDEVVKKIKSN